MTEDRTSSGARVPSDGASTLDLSGRCVGSSYLLVRPIGQGATGTVWRGVDRSSGEPVAVKLLHESLLRQPKLVTRFVQERTILLMLRHRNVVRVRDLFSVGETLGLVMDLVAGGSLRDHLRDHPTMPPGEVARLAAQVAAALAEAHELGVIHRDLKPDNILLQTEDGRLDTRLTDFGVARILSTPSMTTPNAVVGTPHYMSPESFHGSSVSTAADIYALGVLIYEMVCGRPPYDSDSIPDLMRRHLQGNPERRPGVPDELWDLILSCMQQKPRLRPSAAELLADLSDLARRLGKAPALPAPSGPRHLPEPIEPKPVSLVPAPRAPRPRNQAPSWRWVRPGASMVLIAGAMLAAGVVTTAWNLGRAHGDPGDVTAAPPSGQVTVAPVRPRATISVQPRKPSVRAKPAATKRVATRRAATKRVPTKAAPTRRAKPEDSRKARTRAPKPPTPWKCSRRFSFDLLAPGPCGLWGHGLQDQGTGHDLDRR
ncbi:serine/threonine protein kinase [Micromonosporaceae bacterium Da 78-11]